ncbi:MAG: hypothetical protein ACFB0C_22275 [Leptolyngbyaceae cyanobacterium]
MPSEPSSSQSISISGSTVTNSPIAQAEGNINQYQQTGTENSAEQLQPSEDIWKHVERLNRHANLRNMTRIMAM